MSCLWARLNHKVSMGVQLLTEEKVKIIIKEAKEETTQQVLILMALAELAKHNLDVLVPFIKDFKNSGLWQPMGAFSVISILQLYGLSSEVC